MKSNSDSKKFDWLNFIDLILIDLTIIVFAFLFFKTKYFNFVYKENIQEYTVQVRYSNFK